MQSINENIIHRFQNKALAIEINKVLMEIEKIAPEDLEGMRFHVENHLRYLKKKQIAPEDEPGTITDLVEYRAGAGQ